MRVVALVIAAVVGLALGVFVAAFEPFDTLAIVAPLVAGTAAALAMQTGDRRTRIVLFLAAVGGWILGLLLDVGQGRAAGATGPGQVTPESVRRAAEATVGMTFSVAVGIGVGLYLRATDAFSPERRGHTAVVGAATLAIVIVLVAILFVTQAVASAA